MKGLITLKKNATMLKSEITEAQNYVSDKSVQAIEAIDKAIKQIKESEDELNASQEDTGK